MSKSALDVSASPVCRHCGAPISGAPYTREHGEYGCESCFLAARRQCALPPEADEAQFALAEALVCALDAREHETGLHSRRVACHTLVLAKHFTADSRQLRQVYWGALLHDIGKVGIPDAILLKQGSLTDHEWQIMRTHPEIGHRILANVPLMAEAADLVLNHEERFDGTGYPRGLAGEAVPLWARLFAVIDTLDAVTSDRPYRSALGFDAACAEIAAHAGTQFDPFVLDVFRAEQATLRTMVELKCGTVEVHHPLPGGAASAQHRT
ncbi:MAG: HD-GYP domain-containing protein [Betaproteobacteria bacterium]|nr:HD-GYP domain-containing protein [Betaproteobacteria bacterium]